jgi:hypothetical protein
MMNLQVLKLAHNKINGGLPVSYASFRNLRILDLSHNELAGTLPLEYAVLDNLQVGDNVFVHLPCHTCAAAATTMFVPDQHVALSDFVFDRHMHAGYASFKKLRVLDLSHNDAVGFHAVARCYAGSELVAHSAPGRQAA